MCRRSNIQLPRSIITAGWHACGAVKACKEEIAGVICQAWPVHARSTGSQVVARLAVNPATKATPAATPQAKNGSRPQTPASTNTQTPRQTAAITARRVCAAHQTGSADSLTVTGGGAREITATGAEPLQAARLKTRVPLVPPKPKLFFTATSIFMSRAVLAQ